MKKFLAVLIVVVLIVAAWMLYMYLQGNRQATVELQVDRAIEKIEIYDARDDQNPVATLFPVFDGRRNEVSLKVYQDVQYQRTLHAIFYYFIIYKEEGGFKSDTFTFDKHADRTKLVIGETGQWQIIDQ